MEFNYKILDKRYKAVAFDVDGTLTPFAKFLIPHSLKEALAAIPAHIPKAICTGRPINNIGGHVDSICEISADPVKEKKSWTIIAENGGAIYTYHPKKQVYEMDSEIPWPDNKITREALEAFIKDKLGRHVVIDIRDHCLVTRYPNWMYIFPQGIRLVSRHTAWRLRNMLKKMNLDKDILVADSGIGNLIMPKESGKGKAIEIWAKSLGIPVNDILVIGDQPCKGENDEDFLSGEYGTAFTVGSLTENPWPLPVVDFNSRRLKGPEGTEWLVRNVRWEMA